MKKSSLIKVLFGGLAAVAMGVVVALATPVTAEAAGHTHCVCGATEVSAEHHTCENVTWQAWSSTTSLPTATGNYYLTGDVKITTDVMLPTGVSVAICLNGHNITSSGPRVYRTYNGTGHNSDVTLTVTDCTANPGTLLNSRVTNDNTGGIFWFAGTGNTLNLYNGVYTTPAADYATTKNGGVIALEGSANLNFYGGVIKDGRTGGYGANVYMSSTGAFNIYGGSIQGGNGTKNGGSVFLGKGLTTMYDGEIRDGVTGDSGGCLAVQSSATFYMKGGRIFGGARTTNKDYNSANIFVHGNAGNAYFEGGYVAGRINVMGITTLGFAGNPVIHDGAFGMIFNNTNTAVTSQYIQIGTPDKDHMEAGADILVTGYARSGNTNFKFRAGDEAHIMAHNAVDSDRKAFSTSLTTQRISYQNGNLILQNPASHCVCGGVLAGKTNADGTAHTCKNVTWKPWDGSETGSMPTTSGYYYLTSDFKNTTLNIVAEGAEIYIDLNGYTVTSTASRIYTTYVSDTKKHRASVTWSICDTSGGLGGMKVDRTGSDQGCIIWGAATTSSKLTIYNGRFFISNLNYMGNVSKFGALFSFTSPTSEFILYSGEIRGGKAQGHGGNIYMTGTNASFIMMGGVIAGGEAHGYVSGTSNDGGNGGNIAFRNGTIKLLGGEIKDGIAIGGFKEDHTGFGGRGGNVYIDGAKSITIGNVVMENGSARLGGNLYLTGTTAATLNGTVLKDGIAQDETEIYYVGSSNEKSTATSEGNGGNLYTANTPVTLQNVKILGTCEKPSIESGNAAVTFKSGEFEGELNVATGKISGGFYTVKPESKWVLQGYSLRDADAESEMVPGLIFNYEVIAGYEVFTTSRVEGQPASVSNTFGGGVYATGTLPTVGTEPVTGYRFLGWYTLTGTDTLTAIPGATAFTYKPSAEPKETVTYVALFTPDADMVRVHVTAPGFRIKVGTGAYSQVMTDFLSSFPRGTAISVQYENADPFRNWSNSSKKVLSRETEYAFTVVTTTDLEAYTGGSEIGSKMVLFLNDRGQVVKSVNGALTESDIPAGNVRYGQTFKGWALKDENDVLTASQVVGAAAAMEYAEFRMVYESSADTWTLKVQNATSLKADPSDASFFNLTLVGAPDTKTFGLSEPALVTVPETLATGEKFAAAVVKSANGYQVLSTEPEFMIRGLDGEIVYAVYAKATAVKKPAIAMTMETAVPQADGRYTYMFATSRNVPENYRVLEQGIVFTNDAKIDYMGAVKASADTLPESGKGIVYRSNSTLNRDVTVLNMKNIAGSDMQVYARGYMICEDENGNRETYSTGLAYGSADTEFRVMDANTEFTDHVWMDEYWEIGKVGLETKMPIYTENPDAVPSLVTVNVDGSGIVAEWNPADPKAIKVHGTVNNATATLTVVVDGKKLAPIQVLVKNHVHTIGTLEHIQTGEGEKVTFEPWTDSAHLPTAAGYYYLETDVTLTSSWNSQTNKEIVLCYNGHTIHTANTGANNCRTLTTYTKTNSTVTYVDCREEGGITVSGDRTTNQGAAIWATGTGNVVNVYGGTITRDETFVSAASYGALVSAAPGAVINMYGGKITGGFNASSGGNVGLSGGEFNMYGGEISDGHVHSNDVRTTNGGNVCVRNSGIFNMYEGAVIKGGIADENIYAAIATNGVHQGRGGNVTVMDSAQFNCYGGTITEGYCAVIGGNIFINGTAHVTLRDAIITDAYSWAGGGIYADGGTTLTIEGHTVIKGNQYTGGTSTRGGGLYLANATVDISGSPEIIENSGKSNDMANNLAVQFGCSVNIHDLTEDAKIGIFTAAAANPYGMVTREAFATVDKDYTENLIPDDKTGFSVKYNAGKMDMVPFESNLMIGFARVDITPDYSVPMAGFGRTWARMSTNVLTDSNLEATCFAITGNGGTVLLFTTDIINSSYADTVRKAISRETGIPYDNILMTATHTHSGPDIGFTNQNYPTAYNAIQKYRALFTERHVEAAKAALADRAMVTGTYTGAVNAERVVNGKTYTMNWVRHYTLQDAQGNYAGVKGDNFNQLYNKTYTGSVDADGDLVNPAWVTNTITLSGHTTQADSSMRVTKFTRADDKKDLVLVNWRAHPTMTGGSAKTDISADYVGAFRKELEAKTGCLSGFFQGAAGNINAKSSIDGESFSSDFREYGKQLATYAIGLYNNMNEVENDGSIEVISETYTGLQKNQDFYTAEEVAAAQKISAMFTAKGNSNELYELCRLTGNMVHSAYDANGTVSRSKTVTATRSMTIYGFRLGNMAFTEGGFEMFDTNGKFIRESGLAMGFDNVFVMGYSNSSNSYIPSMIGYTQGTDKLFGSYEGDQSIYRPIQFYVDEAGNHYAEQNAAGTLKAVYTGEDVADHFVSILERLKANH